MEGAVKYATTEKPGQVPMHQEELEKVVTMLQEKLIVLEERLKTVVREEDAKNSGVEEQDSLLVSNALFLYIIGKRIGKASSKVNSLLERLEL